jgi:hypothetical protein
MASASQSCNLDFAIGERWRDQDAFPPAFSAIQPGDYQR